VKDFDFFEAAQYIGEKNLVTASSGNLSYLWSDDSGKKLWITASGSWLSQLSLDDLVECSFPEGYVVRTGCPGAKPSSELDMHLEILRAREDVKTVLHFQSPCATMLAASNRDSWDDMLNTIPEIPYYIGDIGWVEYYTPGSHVLADRVAFELKTHDVVFLQNHGQVAVGTSLKDVIQKASFVELASSIVVHGKSLNLLTTKQRQELVEYRNKK
jgi:ribulose-5-phosphate 4-epimerase/fuculose-1-phosphate aldolase